MKTLLIAVAVLMFLPKAHAQSCSVTITPPSFTLQTGNTQSFTVSETNCTGTLSWTTPSCTPVNSCGTLSSTTATTTTFTAPGASLSSSTPEVITLNASYSGTGIHHTGGGNKSASITVTAVQLNSLLNYQSTDNTDFQDNVVANQYVTGVNVLMDWKSIESSSGSQSGGYSFTTFENGIASLFTLPGQSSPSYTKKINIIVQGITGGCAIGNTATCGNTSTPTYVFTSGWANTVNHSVNPLTHADYSTPVPLDVWYSCGYGVSGTDTGFPAATEAAFYVAYQNFINEVLTQYSSTSALAPYIGYIRFGLSAGGEVYPFCEGTGHYSQSDWLTYVSNMDSYESGVNSGLSPKIQLMTSINQTNFPSNYTYPDDEAGYAITNGIGFGSQGLQQGDISSTTPCPTQSSTSDWCYLFYYPSVPTVPLELQTTLLSDPAFASGGTITPGTPSQTGSLSQIIPYAVANHAEIFELYAYDMLYAFDSNYCNLSGATQACTGVSPTWTPTYQSCYATLLKETANGVAPSSPYYCN
jgi:hypothetical protein